MQICCGIIAYIKKKRAFSQGICNVKSLLYKNKLIDFKIN